MSGQSENAHTALEHNPEMFCLISSCVAQQIALTARLLKMGGKQTEKLYRYTRGIGRHCVVNDHNNSISMSLLKAARDRALQPPAIHKPGRRSKYWILLCLIEFNKTLAIGSVEGYPLFATGHYLIWIRSLLPEVTAAGTGNCGARQESNTDTWWTQETVQFGAQDFSERYSRRMSSVV